MRGVPVRDVDKFVNASLDNFDADALLETQRMMLMVLEGEKATNDQRYDCFATYGKVAIELLKRAN